MLIVGEKRMKEESGAALSQQHVGTIKNKNLSDIAKQLEKWFKETDGERASVSSEGWSEYLFVALIFQILFQV